MGSSNALLPLFVALTRVNIMGLWVDRSARVRYI
jgi:hypothetical protein